MIEIIPAIIAQNFQEVEEKIKSVEGLVEWVQIDAMDGRFVVPKTFNSPQQLLGLKTDLKLEAHLMIDSPWEYLGAWTVSGAKRILVHYEAAWHRMDAVKVFDAMIEESHVSGCEFGIAINPDTPIDVLDPYILKIDTVQIMGVRPGWAGQPIKEVVLAKIQDLREKYSGVKIEVDGGVNLNTAPEIVSAGANCLIVGSYIWQAEDKKKAIEELRNASR